MVNLFRDPGFESGALYHDWREVDPDVTGTSRVVSHLLAATDPGYGTAIAGDWSLRLSVSANTGGPGTLVSVGQRFPAAAGSLWAARAVVGLAGSQVRGGVVLSFLDGAAAKKGSETDNGIVGGQAAELLLVEGTAPAGTVQVLLELILSTEAANGKGAVTVDDVALVEGVGADRLDGDQGAMEWLGPRFYSASAEQGEAAALRDYEGWTPPYMWSDVVVPPELVVP